MRAKQDGMSAASGLQLRRKTLAALIGVWLVACGFLARQHEATVAHAVERATGQLVHAERLSGHHDSNSIPDVHDRGVGHADHDVCLEAALLRTAALSHGDIPVVAGVSPSPVIVEQVRASGEDASRRVYRLAPKTSPPAS
jgi:hypothetical protein